MMARPFFGDLAAVQLGGTFSEYGFLKAKRWVTSTEAVMSYGEPED